MRKLLIHSVVVLLVGCFIYLSQNTVSAGGWATSSNGKYFKVPESMTTTSVQQQNTDVSTAYKEYIGRFYRIIAEDVYRLNPEKGGSYADGVAQLIIVTSMQEDVNPLLAAAVARVESEFNNEAISPVGAMGMFQLMPKTAAGLGVRPQVIDENTLGGIRYLKHQINHFQNTSLAIAAYNAGPGEVEAYRGIPPFRETINYVQSVSAIYESYVARFQNGG